MWVYAHDVTISDGPLHYVKGSHKMTPQKLRWLHKASIGLASATAQGHFGDLISPVDGLALSAGSEGIGAEHRTAEVLRSLGLPPPTPMVGRRFTLVVADTSGFHCRGIAGAGVNRTSFRPPYGQLLRYVPFTAVPAGCSSCMGNDLDQKHP